MSPLDLSQDDIATILAYARRKYAEERWPLSPDLRPVREIIEKLKPKPAPLPERKPYVPSTLAQKRGRR